MTKSNKNQDMWSAPYSCAI